MQRLTRPRLLSLATLSLLALCSYLLVATASASGAGPHNGLAAAKKKRKKKTTTVLVHCASSTFVTCRTKPGLPGPPGANGLNGAPGAQGPIGPQGPGTQKFAYDSAPISGDTQHPALNVPGITVTASCTVDGAGKVTMTLGESIVGGIQGTGFDTSNVNGTNNSTNTFYTTSSIALNATQALGVDATHFTAEHELLKYKVPGSPTLNILDLDVAVSAQTTLGQSQHCALFATLL